MFTGINYSKRTRCWQHGAAKIQSLALILEREERWVEGSQARSLSRVAHHQFVANISQACQVGIPKSRQQTWLRSSEYETSTLCSAVTSHIMWAWNQDEALQVRREGRGRKTNAKTHKVTNTKNRFTSNTQKYIDGSHVHVCVND